MTEPPIMTITPLDDAQPDPGRWSVRAIPRLDLARAGLWLVSAALLVGATFATLMHIVIVNPSNDTGAAGTTFSERVNAWGQVAISRPAGVDYSVGSSSGPRYGLLFCACAALMVLGAAMAIVEFVRPQRNLTGTGRGAVARGGISGAGPAVAGALLMAGVLAGLVDEDWGLLNRPPDGGGTFTFGLGLWLAVAGCLLTGAAWVASKTPVPGHPPAGAADSPPGEPAAPVG